MSARVAARNVRLKRAYDPAAAGDGVRILVDRLWPRGISKSRLGLDQWMKDIAPSAGLRKWFGHDPERWAQFRSRYAEELRANTGRVGELRALAREGPITLVYAAHDEIHNDAVVLRDLILGR